MRGKARETTIIVLFFIHDARNDMRGVYVCFFSRTSGKAFASLPHIQYVKIHMPRYGDGWTRVKTCHIPLRVGWSVMHSARLAILYYISRFVSFPLCYNLTRLCPFPSPVATVPAGELCRTDRTTAGWERLACDRQPIFHNYWYPVDSLQDYQKDTIASDNILHQKLTFLGHSRFAWDRECRILYSDGNNIICYFCDWDAILQFIDLNKKIYDYSVFITRILCLLYIVGTRENIWWYKLIHYSS